MLNLKFRIAIADYNGRAFLSTVGEMFCFQKLLAKLIICWMARDWPVQDTRRTAGFEGIAAKCCAGTL